ncbi:hypothetical protein ACFLQ8_00480 [Candidatus Auribacterota bacterium]
MKKVILLVSVFCVFCFITGCVTYEHVTNITGTPVWHEAPTTPIGNYMKANEDEQLMETGGRGM